MNYLDHMEVKFHNVRISHRIEILNSSQLSLESCLLSFLLQWTKQYGMANSRVILLKCRGCEINKVIVTCCTPR